MQTQAFVDAERTPRKTEGPAKALVERAFESVLWNSRFTVLLAVVFGLVSAVCLFVIGSLEVTGVVQQLATSDHHESAEVVKGVIEAIDLYLIAVVVLLFTFGIYELFISKIDVGRCNQEIKILEITNLDELKNRLIKVIIIVLVVAFFERILEMQFARPLDMLYFAVSIFAISCGVHLLQKAETKKRPRETN